MKTQHTPGPWKFVKTIQHPEEKDQAVSFIQTPKTCYDLCFMKSFFTEEEAEANARLIAAAPELLNACLLAIERLDINNMEGEENEFINEIKEAIQKATQP
jgi:hypothetical protein